MPDPSKVLATLRRAATLFRATPGREGSVVCPRDAAELMVVGDLHGHLHTFAAVLKHAALDQHPRRHLVLQELVHDPRVRPDEAEVDLSHRLLDIVCALKCKYPDRAHVLLGNHELSELTGRSIAKNGVFLNALFRKGIEASYGPMADEFSQAYRDLFASLPVAIRTPNRVFICHTLPDGSRIGEVDLDVLRAVPWPPEALKRGGTIYAMTWGRDTSPESADRFASLIDADLFVTGHHPCDRGFQAVNHRHLILDGTDPHPACCLFNVTEPATLETLLAGVRLLDGSAPG